MTSEDNMVHTPFGMIEVPAPRQEPKEPEDDKPHHLFRHLFNEDGTVK